MSRCAKESARSILEALSWLSVTKLLFRWMHYWLRALRPSRLLPPTAIHIFGSLPVLLLPAKVERLVTVVDTYNCLLVW